MTFDLSCLSMKLITLILIAFGAIARGEEDDIEFYVSQMKWSSKSDPIDAGAIDGAYYADLVAAHGVRKVDFDLVSAKEMRNPSWNTDDNDSVDYAVAFVNGFNEEAANRGMIAPTGEPYTHQGKTAQDLTLEWKHWAERAAEGKFDQPSPTPTPGPVTSTLAPMSKEMADKINADRAAEEEQERKLFQKQEAQREAHGDFSRAPGLTPAQRQAAATRWAEKNAAETVKGATPAPQ